MFFSLMTAIEITAFYLDCRTRL